MKRIPHIAILVCVLAVGCSSESNENDESNHSTDSHLANPNDNGKIPSASVVSVSDETHEPSPAQTYTGSTAPEPATATAPDEVCKKFMEALQSGNQATAFQQLTQQAALEMRRAELELEPMGDASSQVNVFPPRYATSKQQVAQVDCEVAGSTITWLLARKTSGWKISGMTVQLEDGGLDLLSFENRVDVSRIKESISGDTGPAYRNATLPNDSNKR